MLGEIEMFILKEKIERDIVKSSLNLKDFHVKKKRIHLHDIDPVYKMNGWKLLQG